MSNFFNARGPIRPQSLLQMTNQDGSASQPNGRPSSAGSNRVQLPQARDFIRQDAEQPQNLPQNQRSQDQLQQQQLLAQMMRGSGANRGEGDIEYGEEEDYGEDDNQSDQRAPQTNYTPQQQEQILRALLRAGSHNEEFMKVLDILQRDEELRPLIFEHETLLQALKDMPILKAEMMLSILTAAETEMYESSKARDDLQATNQNLRRQLMETTQTAQYLKQEVRRHVQLQMEREEEKARQENERKNSGPYCGIPEHEQRLKIQEKEIETLRVDLQDQQLQNLSLTKELSLEKQLREDQEREKECTFKNLYDECQQLKKANETLRQKESEAKQALEQREQLLKRELDDMKIRLRDQEVLRSSILETKNQVEQDLKRNQEFIEMLQKEISMLEKENENAHRKLNSTFNSILFQSYLNKSYLNGIKQEGDQTEEEKDNNGAGSNQNNTPARRNLSTSFQNSGLLLDQRNANEQNSMIGQPVFGQSTQRLKLMMSENYKSQGTQSFVAHSIYYGLGGGIGGYNQQALKSRDQKNSSGKTNNIYFSRGEALVRSNSIEVILLDDKESQKQNFFLLGEEEKHNESADLVTNKQSWLRSKGLFTELSPINSVASQSIIDEGGKALSSKPPLKQKQLQRKGSGDDVILLEHGVKYYEEQIRKMQQEIEKYKLEVRELTQRLELTGNHNNIHLLNENNTSSSDMGGLGGLQRNEFMGIGMLNSRTNESPFQDSTHEHEKKIFATPSQGAYILSSQYNTQNMGLMGETNFRGANINLTSNINPLHSNEQSPMMATFSNQKDRQYQQHFYSQYGSNNNTQNQEQLLTNNFNHQTQSQSSSNLQRATPSEAERIKIIEEYNNKIQNEFASKLKEISNKLISLFKRFNPNQNELNHYFQDVNVSLVKELIGDITSRLDQMIEVGALHHQSRIPNTSSQGVMSQGVGIPLNPQMPYLYYPQTMQMPHLNFGMAGGQSSFSGLQGVPTWFQFPNSAGNVQPGSQIGSTTMDQTAIDDLRKLYFAEKDTRLRIQSDLLTTKENFAQFKLENERLKQELTQEKQNNQTMIISQLNMEGYKYDRLVLELQSLQRKLDQFQDENTNLKMEISQLNADLFDERESQKLRIDRGMQIYKDQLRVQVEEHKDKFEREYFAQREENAQLRAEIRQLQERHSTLREELRMRLERITELERQVFDMKQDANNLMDDLTFEQAKTNEYMQSKNQSKQLHNSLLEQDLLKYKKSASNLQLKNQELSDQIRDMNNEFQRERNKFQIVLFEKENKQAMLEKEINNLTTQNSLYQEQLKEQREQKQNAISLTNQIGAFGLNSAGGFDHLNFSNGRQKHCAIDDKQLATAKLRLILCLNEQRRLYKGLMKFSVFSISERAKAITDETLKNINLNETQHINRAKDLEIQLSNAKQMHAKLSLQLGKVLRFVNIGKPIKLALQGLISKQTFDYLTFGLKENNQVSQINLQQCQLDDEDLLKFCNNVSEDSALTGIRLGQNRFSHLEPFFNFINKRSAQMKVIDISDSKISSKALDYFIKILPSFGNLQELCISNIFPVSRSGANSHSSSSKQDKIQELLLSVLQLQSLRCLDVSYNSFSSQTLSILFSQIKRVRNLESISLAYLNIQDENCRSLIDVIASSKNLRKISLVGNRGISPLNCEYLLQQLSKCEWLEDIDFSKCQVNTPTGIQALAELIKVSKNLKTLYLRKVNLTDQLAINLAVPISSSLNLEHIQLDQNALNHKFLEMLCELLIRDVINLQELRANGSTGQLSHNSSALDIDSNNQSVNHQLTNDFGDGSFLLHVNSKKHSTVQNQGLITLSLEKNPIGDLGVFALARVIETPNEHTKKIKSINLNSCKITAQGFNALRQALLSRGEQAKQNPCLSHIKISIEGNNVVQ